MDRNARTALMAGGIVVAMASLSFAAAPFYSWFCAKTGFGGAITTGTGEGIEVSDKTMIVRFDGSVASGLPWKFEPEVRSMTVRLGETNLAFFRATNLSDRTVTGQASYGLTPDAAGGFLDKIECFCFTEQTLAPHQTVDMPVSFYVDPAILDDADGRGVHEITLGYTFWEVTAPTPPADSQAALKAAAPRAID